MTGFFGNVIPALFDYIGFISLPSYLNPALIGASISLVTIIYISKRGTVTAQEAQYREDLHRTPEIDCDLQKTKTTMLAPAALVLYGCLMPLLLIKYYVTPYQTGVGQLLCRWLGRSDNGRGHIGYAVSTGLYHSWTDRCQGGLGQIQPSLSIK